MEKSSYRRCDSRGRFSTGERNFRWSVAHSSPRAKQHARLLSKLKSSPPSPAHTTPTGSLLAFYICKLKEAGDGRAASLFGPNVDPYEVFLEFKTSLMNHLTQKLQNVTHLRSGRRGGETTGVRAKSLTPHGVKVEQDCHGSVIRSVQSTWTY